MTAHSSSSSSSSFFSGHFPSIVITFNQFSRFSFIFGVLYNFFMPDLMVTSKFDLKVKLDYLAFELIFSAEGGPIWTNDIKNRYNFLDQSIGG